MGKLDDYVIKSLFAACCTIRINGSNVCTGWAASPSCIISVGHVFQHIPASARIEAHFSDGQNCQLYLLTSKYSHAPLIDYSILETDGAFPVTPLKLSNQIALSGNFISCGSGRTLGSLSSVSGKIIGYLEMESKQPVLKIQSGQIGEPGYSGSPIYSMERNAVIAIQSETTETDFWAERDTSLAYPLAYFWKELQSAMKPRSFIPASAGGTRFDQAIDFWREGNILFADGNYPAAAVYYRKAQEILISETGTESKYSINIEKRLKDATEKRKAGENP